MTEPLKRVRVAAAAITRGAGYRQPVADSESLWHGPGWELSRGPKIRPDPRPDEPAAANRAVLDTLPVPYSGPSAGIMGPGGRLPWLVRSAIAGSAGAAALDLTGALERRLTPRAVKPPRIGALYGIGLGVLHGVLRMRTGEPRASLVLGGALVGFTLTTAPLVGWGPAPWRSSTNELALKVTHDAAYAAAVGTTHYVVRELMRGDWTLKLYD
jgi:hypothetical protein